MNILIVDDHAGACEVIRSYLSPLAREIHACFSGEAAIAHCRGNVPDIMTLDLHLGAENGLRVLEFFRAHFPSIKVIMVTQFADAKIAERAQRSGAAACFAKADMVGLRTYLAAHGRAKELS